MRRPLLRWLILVAVPLLLLLPASVGALPSSGFRMAEYRAGLAALPSTQNPDGGFGEASYNADGNLTGTVRAPSSLLATVAAVHLLALEQTDLFANWTSTGGSNTSLAASNVPNALDWLRTYENDPALASTPGEDALLALAYSRLGDTGNAARILHGHIAAEAAAPGTLLYRDAAQTVFALARVPVATNASENATILQLDGRLSDMEFFTFEGLSWGLLAQPQHAERRDALLSALAADASIGATILGLAAWAVAASGGPDAATEEVLSAAHESATTGLAGTYRLLGERRAHPEFSPHAPPGGVPAIDSTDIPSRAFGNSGPTGSIAPPIADAADTAAADTDDGGFPLPPWLMAGILLVALSALGAVGLAYGLKRDDLSGIRRDIFNYIENHPGEHFSKIRRDLGLAPGTFQHHLSVLESDGWIASHKDARYKRYFVNGNRYQQIIAGLTYRQKFAALANSTTRDFVRFIHDNPGATQKMVAERLRIHASTVNWHANRLKQAGILHDERVGKEVRYTVDGDVVDKMLAPRQEELVAAA